MDSREILDRLSERSARTFQSESHVRSFPEHLDEVLRDPLRHGRIAARYVADCFDHWGTEEVSRTEGTVTRWKLFDAPFDEGRDKLVGQEDVQREFFQALASFARHGRADKLVLLHGPNGSAKTTFCELVFRALEAYSATPEGALHRFAWVFPTREAQGRRMGFAGERGSPREQSYASLEQDEIAAKIACEMKDPPIFLLPPALRRELLPQLAGAPEAGTTHRWLFEGELCAKCRKIFDGLYKLHRGNLGDVLRHVQVERYFISQRYRRGAVRISPQSHVDASEIQVAADRSVSALPAALHDLNLFVPVGDLIDANRGLVEFSDFLKRPLEMNKYLLTTTEKGTITLPTSNAQLNAVLVATSNEAQLDEFKKIPLFQSFAARMDLVQVPYLLSISLEQHVYDELLGTLGLRKHLAPHLARVAATWAVLCRLRRAEPESYPAEVRPVVRELTPLQKARLYDSGEAPRHLPSETRALLRSLVPQMREEYRDVVHYEGRYGPSAREIRAAIMDCRYDPRSACISPISLLRQLRRLVKDKSVHEFLRVEPDNGYHDAEHLVEVTRQVYVEIVQAEVHSSMRLVEPDQYRRVFERYVQHVNATRSGERVRNPVTGKLDEPDQKFIKEVEAVVASGARPDDFRDALMGKIGAWRVDHPSGPVDYAELFPEAVTALQDDYYARNKKIIEDVRDNMVRHGTEDLADLDPDLQKRVKDTMDAMLSEHGYCPDCAKDAIAFLSRNQ
jgi:predicted Ser/Thr protein kinase